MSNTNGDTAISMAIETDNGWRGSVKEIVARKDTERTCSSVEESSDGDLAVGSADDSWLGGEPNLLPVEKEKQGVTDILAALSASERKQLEAFDTTMPIRHFRAEKVTVDMYHELTLKIGKLPLSHTHSFVAFFGSCRVTLRKLSLRLKQHCNGELTLEWM